MSLEERIIQADPALGVDVPSGTSPGAQWAYPTRSALAVQHTRRRRRVSVASVVASVAAVAVIFGLVLLPGNSAQGQSAAQFLRANARLVANQPPLTPLPGQFLYFDQSSQYQVSAYLPDSAGGALDLAATAQYQESEHTWLDAGGTSSEQVTRSALSFPTSNDNASWSAIVAAQAFSATYRQSVAQPSRTGSIPDVSSLSTDPTKLAQQLHEDTPTTNPDKIPDGTNAVFERAGRLLVGPESGLTPVLSAALYQVLALQPGVTLLGPTVDHQGRTGTAVSLSTKAGLSEVIVNPETGAALEAVYAPPARSLPNSSAQTSPVCSLVSCTLVGPGPGRLVQAALWTDNLSTSIVPSADRPSTTTP